MQYKIVGTTQDTKNDSKPELNTRWILHTEDQLIGRVTRKLIKCRLCLRHAEEIKDIDSKQDDILYG